METPTPVNPLGAKGIGESGTIGSTPAVQSAVVDAVAHLGVRHIDMPATPERVWRAIRATATGELATVVDSRLTGIELRRVAMPLRTPFRTSFGTELDRDVLLVRAEGTVDGDGRRRLGRVRGDGRAALLRRVRRRRRARHRQLLRPAAVRRGDVAADDVAPLLAVFEGHPMAKAAVEMAVLDAELRGRGRVASADHLGAVTRPCACRRVGRDHRPTSPSCSTRSPATSTTATCASS